MAQSFESMVNVLKRAGLWLVAFLLCASTAAASVIENKGLPTVWSLEGFGDWLSTAPPVTPIEAFLALMSGLGLWMSFFQIFFSKAPDVMTRTITGALNQGFGRVLEAIDGIRISTRNAAKEGVEAGVASLRRENAVLKAQVSEVLAILRSQGKIQSAEERGVPFEAIQTIVERLGGEGVDTDSLITWLENWIEQAVTDLSRHKANNEGEAFDRAMKIADDMFRQGRLDKMSEPFMAELERVRARRLETEAEYKRQELALIDEAIRRDEMAVNIDGVLAKILERLTVDGQTDDAAINNDLLSLSDQYRVRGEREIVPTALFVAQRLCYWLMERARDESWMRAAAQNSLGNVLRALGARQDGEAGLEALKASEDAYRAALEVRTRKDFPVQWAMTQNNLGAVLSTLGERQDGEAGLEALKASEAAYRSALEVTTRKDFPMQWATTQNNLGVVLRNLGERQGGVAGLEALKASEDAYRSALEIRTRKDFPVDWAMTRGNIGNLCVVLFERTREVAHLERGIAAVEGALEVFRSMQSSYDIGTAERLLARLKALRGEA